MVREEVCNAVLVASGRLAMSFSAAVHLRNGTTIKSSAKRSVAHLGPQRVRSSSNEFEASRAPTVGALRSNGFLVEHFVLICLQPHQLGALWTGSDLR